MNFVYISPNFPPSYYLFCQALAEVGATVLGIGDAPYEELLPELRNCLTEYYRVESLENFAQVEEACRHFERVHGTIDRIESNNEYWLEADAHLREIFNVPGLHPADMALIKSKKAMKEGFQKADIEVVEGIVVQNLEEALEAVQKIGFPVVLKPDTGVGANFTELIHNDQDLTAFFEKVPPNTYIMEEYIVGTIHSFDGIVDKEGNVGFYSVFRYGTGVMEAVLAEDDHYFGSSLIAPPDLVKAGLAAVEAFDVRERYFHIEFFVRNRDGSIIGLETNMRPPGEPCVHVINYANDLDTFKEYAKMIVNGVNDPASLPPNKRKYACYYVGRRTYKYRYVLSHQEVCERFGHLICTFESLPSHSWKEMGNQYYILRSDNEAELAEAIKTIQKRV